MASAPWHLRFTPFQIVNGRAGTVEQDSPEDVLQCVETIMRFRRGQRPDAPDFGVPDQAHRQGGADPAEVLDAIERFEPRAHRVAAELETDLAGLMQIVRVRLGDEGG
jgi:phage baseplate assembly protein W